MARQRHGGYRVRTNTVQEFINPFSNMPGTEARIYIALSQRSIPFSWRYFNGQSVFLKTLMPDWNPEFTLRDYKIAIIVQGSFFGNIPSVLDRAALGQAILEQEGWKVLVWFEADIIRDVNQLIDSVPQLRSPHILGRPYANPYGTPDVLAQFRLMQARTKRFIAANARQVSRGTTRRPTGRNGAFVTGRRLRDVRDEAPAGRRRGNRRVNRTRRR